MNLQAVLKTAYHWHNTRAGFSRRVPRVDAEDLKHQLRSRRSDTDTLLAALRHDGVVVVPDYWSAEKCAAARNEIDRLIAEYPDCVHNVSGGSDKRMFGVESVSPMLAEFHDDPFLRQIGETVGGYALHNFATLGARIDATPENNGSGDGWHRDRRWFQFKSILYLSDVTEDNGPFEFLPGSHMGWRAIVDAARGDLPTGTRYEPQQIDRLIEGSGVRRQGFEGTAGTLLLAVTSGIHRGRPLQRGVRYALTNYYMHPCEIDEGKIRQFSPLMPGTADWIRSDLEL